MCSPVVKHNVDLNELISGLAHALHGALGSGTRFSARLCSEPLYIAADPVQLEQVVVNLLLKARDAVADGGQLELVTCRSIVLEGAERDIEGPPGGEYACIEVRDGAIRVDSHPGQGTVMRVLLPLIATHEAGAATSGVVDVACKRGRVLVVEDDPQVRTIAARALSGGGFEVEQAANGALALALLEGPALPFDVIVTDVVMPELNGPELARAARRLDPRVGLVFMSGYPQELFGGHADEFAGAAYLSKPFSPAVLVNAVRERVEELTLEQREHG